jgi:hypothetical protein
VTHPKAATAIVVGVADAIGMAGFYFEFLTLISCEILNT